MTQRTNATQLTLVNPIAVPASHVEKGERHPPAKRKGSLDGKTVALYWNGKQNGPHALDRAKEKLAAQYKGIKFLDVIGEKGGSNRYLSDAQLDMLQRDADAVVGTTADCGSCTSWLVRDLVQLEKRGIPAVGYTAKTFEDDCHLSAKVFGVPDISPVIVPECFSNQTAEDIYKMVDEAWDQVIDGLTKDRKLSEGTQEFEKMRLESAPEIVVQGADLMDAFDNMQALFVKNYWSDGLPLVPPTANKVDAMIRASGRDGDEVVGKFAPGFGIGTVRKIAANAVMAGCKPETMPIIMAMMDCILEPSIGLRTWAMSTGPQFPVVLVSGPYAQAIGMNHGICALGPASVSQVNVSIGRALRLIMMNVGLSYPAITDMDTIGSPNKFSFCVAENEGRTPWPTWREQQGFAKGDTVVSVNVPYGMTEFFDFENPTPEGLIESWSSLTRNASGSPAFGAWLTKTNAPLEQGYPFHGEYASVLLMAPDHAKVFGRAGWKPRDIQLAIHEKTRIPFRELMSNKSWQNFRFAHPELSWLESQQETLVSVNPRPECFEFFVVGGSAGRSQFCFGGSNTVTKKVKLA